MKTFQELEDWWNEKDPAVFEYCPISKGAPHNGNVVHRLTVVWEEYAYSDEKAIYVYRALKSAKSAEMCGDWNPRAFTEFRELTRHCLSRFGFQESEDLLEDESICEAAGQVNCEIDVNGTVMTPPIGSFNNLAAYLDANGGWMDDDVFEYNGQTAYFFDHNALAELLQMMSNDAKNSYGTATAVVRNEDTGDTTQLQFDFF